MHGVPAYRSTIKYSLIILVSQSLIVHNNIMNSVYPICKYHVYRLWITYLQTEK